MSKTAVRGRFWSDVLGGRGALAGGGDQSPVSQRGENRYLHTVFLAGVSAHLEAGGELRLVANTFLPYRSLTVATTTEVLAQDRRFTVYRAFRRKA